MRKAKIYKYRIKFCAVPRNDPQSEHKENYHFIKLRDATRLLIVLFCFFSLFWFNFAFCLLCSVSTYFTLVRFMGTMKVRRATITSDCSRAAPPPHHLTARNGDGCECEKNQLRILYNQSWIIGDTKRKNCLDTRHPTLDSETNEFRLCVLRLRSLMTRCVISARIVLLVWLPNEPYCSWCESWQRFQFTRMFCWHFHRDHKVVMCRSCGASLNPTIQHLLESIKFIFSSNKMVSAWNEKKNFKCCVICIIWWHSTHILLRMLCIIRVVGSNRSDLYNEKWSKHLKANRMERRTIQHLTSRY